MKLFYYLLMLAISLTASTETMAQDNQVTLSASQRQSYGIKVAAPEMVTEITGVGYPAEVVVPNSQLQIISALQNGLVESLTVAEGDHVKQGQVLARLQSPGLLELQRDLLETMTKLNLANTNMKRDKQLLDEGIIPERRYQESRSEWQALQVQKQQQQAVLKISGMTDESVSELAKSRRLTSRLEITAPVDGVVLQVMVTPGEKVDIADPLFRIGSLKPLWLEIHVPVEVASGIKIGEHITVPQLNIDGEIITIGSTVHQADQGTLIRAVVHENLDQLRPGQFVQTSLSRKSLDSKNYLVPSKAIVRIDQQNIIFVENRDGFTAVNVTVIGNRNGQQIIAVDQAIDGNVVTNGAVTLKAILTGAGGEG